MKTEYKEKLCKNKHPIGEDKLIVLGGVVGVCSCGHRYLVEGLPAVYTKDKYNPLKERFHVYHYLAPIVCQKCHAFMTSIVIACHPNDKLKDDWVEELNRQLGRLTEEKKNEDIHSTPDNRSDV